MKRAITALALILIATTAIGQNHWLSDLTASPSGTDRIESLSYAAYIDDYGNFAWGNVFGDHCLDYQSATFASYCVHFDVFHDAYSGYFNVWSAAGCHTANLFESYVSSWGGDGASEEKSADACLRPPPPQCRLSVSAGGGGILSPDPSGTYDCGSTMTLTATPAAGYDFVNWDGDIYSTNASITFTLNRDMTLIANFTPQITPPNPVCGGGTGTDAQYQEDCSPIVLNLSRGGYQLTGKDDPVLFDISGTGNLVSIGWTAAATNQAFLWIDRNGNGRVDSGRELFGTATRLVNGTLAANGFEALREYDDNGDGVVDRLDAVWPRLLLWRDFNHNGISEPNEITFVSTSEVVAIDLAYHWEGRSDSHGNLFRFASKVWLANRKAGEDARAAPLYDIYFVPAP